MNSAVWKPTWSYRGASGSRDGVNGSLWFQIATLVCVLTVWTVAVVRSVGGGDKSERIVTYLLREDCGIAKWSPKGPTRAWIFYPRVIVTRTTASLLIAIGTAELLIFNAIANYAGDGSTNASSAILVLVVGLLFHFFSLTHKFMKTSDSDVRDRFFGVYSGLVLAMTVGFFMCFLSYTDTMRWKDTEGRSMLFFAGAAFACAAAFVGCLLPLLKAFRPFTVKKEDGTVSLILSGEYYAAFSFLDCAVVWAIVTNFVCSEAYFISRADTKNYALPFVFLQALPLYGFGTAIASLVKSDDVLPGIFNAGLFAVMSLSVTTSMLHVCAVPGVETACTTSMSHTMLNTNLLVCAPCLVLLTLMSVGLINSTFAPNLLIRNDCIEKNR